MNDRSVHLYKEALKDGVEKVYSIRVMVVGHLGVGKTTLIRRLLGKDVNISERQSTAGIDVHMHCCTVSLETEEWTARHEDSEQNLRLQRLAKLLTGQSQTKVTDKKKEQIGLTSTAARTQDKDVKVHVDDKNTKSSDISCESTVQDVSSRSAQEDFPSALVEKNSSDKNTDSDTRKMQILTNNSGTNQKNNTMMEMLKLLHENRSTIRQGTGEHVLLTMLDFAGQYVFYTTHQTFLTKHAIYLLVSDISQQVENVVNDDCYFDTEGVKVCKVYELVEVWLNSIHSCAPSIESGFPPVILVGTHVDKIRQDKREAICEDYFRKIRYYLGDKPTKFHLTDVEFAIDNTISDSKLKNLRSKIVQIASTQPNWGKSVPAKWLPLEEQLMKLKAAGVKVIPYSVLEKINEEEAVKIETREGLDLFLRFHHEIGTVLYFSTVEELKEHIVLEPQWLIDALKSIITAESFILRKMPGAFARWKEFKESGKLTEELIDVIWSKGDNEELHKNKTLILQLMEQLNIIAKPRLPVEAGVDIKDDKYYIVPCMLQKTAQRKVISPEPNPQMESSSVLCYVSTQKFLPPPIFHRLLAACIAHWPIAKKESKDLIFCGCCVFQIDHSHKLVLHFRDYVLFARMTKMGIKDKNPNPKLCVQAREFITENLSKIIGYLCQNLHFELSIQCPESEADNLNSVFPVAKLKEREELSCSSHGDDHVVVSRDLLRFWFEDETVADPQNQGAPVDTGAPITQEHINYARLCNALLTVCSEALREILQTQVSVPHKNIFQAILANKVNLTSRRQIRPGQYQNALLNNDQCQVVFPDPSGRYTGTLDQFDISLLYILIRNVSSVLAPATTGWGKQPTEKPRDTALGASTERIRQYRNCTSGHSVDGKIDQQKFEDYWNKISEVLCDIENVIGNRGYTVELEKRRNQVITPNEAHELHQKFQEYKKQVEAEADIIESVVEDFQSGMEKIQSALKRIKDPKN